PRRHAGQLQNQIAPGVAADAEAGGRADRPELEHLLVLLKRILPAADGKLVLLALVRRVERGQRRIVDLGVARLLRARAAGEQEQSGAEEGAGHGSNPQYMGEPALGGFVAQWKGSAGG